MADDMRKPRGGRRRGESGARPTHTVEEGETLQSLAARFYGSATEWRRLYEANREALGDDPNLPTAGTELLVPSG
jgi:nucleoid-associated protein YgaU